MKFDNAHLYLMIPIAYAMELQAALNREKARCFFEYAIDLGRGRGGSIGFYAKSWGKSKDTSWRWVNEFKEEIDKFNQACIRKNNDKLEKSKAEKNKKCRTLAKRQLNYSRTIEVPENPNIQGFSEEVPNGCQTTTERLPNKERIDIEIENLEDIDISSFEEKKIVDFVVERYEEVDFGIEVIEAVIWEISLKKEFPASYRKALLEKYRQGDCDTVANINAIIIKTRRKNAIEVVGGSVFDLYEAMP